MQFALRSLKLKLCSKESFRGCEWTMASPWTIFFTLALILKNLEQCTFSTTYEKKIQNPFPCGIGLRHTLLEVKKLRISCILTFAHKCISYWFKMPKSIWKLFFKLLLTNEHDKYFVCIYYQDIQIRMVIGEKLKCTTGWHT